MASSYLGLHLQNRESSQRSYVPCRACGSVNGVRDKPHILDPDLEL